MTKKKIALVTGGSRGLGKDMALALSKKGMDVVLTYNTNKVEADNVVTEIQAAGNRAIALQFDVSKIASFDSFLNQLKEVLKDNWDADRFDFLINNAGIGASIPIAQLSEDRFD